MSAVISPLSAYSGNYFTGMSSYSQDLNNAIAREVQIASLPIQLLQNNLNALNRQSSELQKLNTDFTAVQTALTSLSSAAANLLSASVSNPSVATATLGSGAIAGNYTLEVTSLGAYSNALSLDGLPKVTDPGSQSISASGSYTLTVNGQAVEPPITPAAGDLNSLVQAINAAGAGVQATVVNVGSSSQPDYRLSLQSDSYADISMQLNDGHGDLLKASGPPGEPVQYTINGKSVAIDSRSVTLAPGLTVNLTGTNAGAPAVISVAPTSSGIADALESFVSAYNTAMGELNNNRGPGGGALAGQSIVYQLTNSLQSLANYSGGAAPFSTLASLGVVFNDDTGELSFDRSIFDSATAGQTSALAAFLGSTSGGGFLGVAAKALMQIEDPVTGILTSDIDSVQSSIDRTNQKISDEQDQVSQLQQNLTRQMAAADAMLYSLQQQASYFEQMFATQRATQMAGM